MPSGCLMGIEHSGIFLAPYRGKTGNQMKYVYCTVVPRYRRHSKIIYNTNLGTPPYSGWLLGLDQKTVMPSRCLMWIAWVGHKTVMPSRCLMGIEFAEILRHRIEARRAIKCNKDAQLCVSTQVNQNFGLKAILWPNNSFRDSITFVFYPVFRLL